MQIKPFYQIFTTKLSKPNLKIDTFVVVNILLVIGLCFLINYKTFLPAGINIELANSEYVQQVPVQHTITVKSENLLILNDSISSIKSLKSDINLQNIHNKTKNFDTAVLLRVDRTVPLETIIKISNILQEIGYSNVQLALNKPN